MQRPHLLCFLHGFICYLICFVMFSTSYADGLNLRHTKDAQNRVLQLDGQGDYVQLPSNIFNNLDEATIEGWVKWEQFRYFSQPFGFGNGEKWRVMAVNNRSYLSDLQYFIYIQMKLYCIKVPGILQLGQWYHIAAVSGRS